MICSEVRNIKNALSDRTGVYEFTPLFGSGAGVISKTARRRHGLVFLVKAWVACGLH